MVKQFITIQETKRRSKIRRNSYKPKLNKLNFCIGSVLVGLGVISLPIPCGSIFLLAGGVSFALCPIPINKLVGRLYDDICFKLGCWW